MVEGWRLLGHGFWSHHRAPNRPACTSSLRCPDLWTFADPRCGFGLRLFSAAASCAEFDTTIRLGMRFAISKFKCVWWFLREKWQIANSFILPQKGTITKTSQSSINFMKVTCFCQRLLFLGGKLLMLELVNFTWQEQQFLLLLHVCKMLVEYAVQSSQSQVRGMSVMEREAAIGVVMSPHVAVWLLYHTSILLLLHYQLYLTDSTHAIRKHPRFYLPGFVMHGKSVWYALEESVQGSQLILHPTVRQLLTLKLCLPGSFVWLTTIAILTTETSFSCLERSQDHHFFPYSPVVWHRNGKYPKMYIFLVGHPANFPTFARFWWTPKSCVKAYGRPLKISVPWKPWKIAAWTQRLW